MLGRLCRRTEVWGASRWFALAADAVQDVASTSDPLPTNGEVETLRKRLKISNADVKTIHERMGERIELDKTELSDLFGSAGKRGKVAENMDLLKVFGFSSGDQKSLLMRSPVVFTEEKAQLEKFWGCFVKDYGFDNNKLKAMVLYYPKALDLDLEGVIIPSLEAFINMGFSKDQTKEIVLDYPQGLQKCGKTLKPMLKVFREAGFSKNDFVELVSKVPHTLRGSVEDKGMLIKELVGNGLTQEETRVLLMECKQLTTESYSDNLKPKFQFLEDLGIAKLAIIHKIIKKAGFSVFATRLETMKDSFRCMVSLGISQDMYKEMVCKSPFILGQGPESLKDKIDFATEVMKRNIEDVVYFAPYLTYCLERRIMYRAAIKISTGEDLNEISLRNLLLPPHQKFCRRYKQDYISRLTEWWGGLTKEEKWKAVESQTFMV